MYLFPQVWFKNKRAKCRQQSKKQPGSPPTKPAQVKTKTPSPPPKDQDKPNNTDVLKPTTLPQVMYAQWPQHRANPLEQDMQAVRQANYQPTRAVINNVGSTPVSIHQSQFPDFSFAKNNPMAGWLPINPSVQTRYYTPSIYT